MNLQAFLNTLNNQPENLQFADTMAIIEALYDFAPTSFKNGNVDNGAGQNNGSCKLFAFAKLQGFNEQQTLNCFGAYYRADVLKNPAGTDHQNIRNFMQTGWAGVEFAGQALTEK